MGSRLCFTPRQLEGLLQHDDLPGEKKKVGDQTPEDAGFSSNHLFTVFHYLARHSLGFHPHCLQHLM